MTSICCIIAVLGICQHNISAELSVDDEVALASVFRVVAEDVAVEFTQPLESFAASQPLHRPANFECRQPSRWLGVNGP